MATTSAAEPLRVPGRPDHGAAGAHLAELFARHGATVLGLCRLLLRHREEAEDAVQQTFLAAYRSLLNGIEPRHPAAWLATIARNECWGRIEQRMREPLSEREPESTLPDPVAAAAARADLAELLRAIGDLPRQQRQALLLREFSGLSYVELAGALAVSEPAVESLLFRARRQLRLRLRPVYGAAGGIAPLAAIREALARAIFGMPDPTATGALAKIVSAPLVAKLALGAAAIAVTGGTVAAVESHSVRHGTPSRSGPASQPARDVTMVAAGAPVSAGIAPAKSRQRRAGGSALPVRRLSPRQVPAAARSAPSPAPTGSASRGVPAPAVPSTPASSGDDVFAVTSPTASSSEPDGSLSSTDETFSGSGDGTTTGVGSESEGSGFGNDVEGADGTSTTSGVSTSDGSGSSGSDELVDSSGDGSGTSGGDSGSGDDQSSTTDTSSGDGGGDGDGGSTDG